MNSSLPQEIIARKRDGAELSAAEIQAFVRGITSGDVVDAQIGAFTMAVLFQGMTAREGADLTTAMTHSGKVIDWATMNIDRDAPIVDKHSTGGVGDKVSLMLAPIVAACGAYVPMISGRGLGHTGGTLDKLDSIPGYDTAPSVETFETCVKLAGCAIIGQTSDLAPADKRMYGVRDISATVESVPLITASILSKKLAAGLNALVMDVKVGNGAVLQSRDKAEELAHSIVSVACAAGVPTTAMLTDMDEILGVTAGNALEVREAVDFLINPGSPDGRLKKLVLDLAGEMLSLIGLADTSEAGQRDAEHALDSGLAAEKFATMVHALGGPVDFIDRHNAYLPVAPVIRDITSCESGYVTGMDTRAIGMAIVAMGGGRTKPQDTLDYTVGLSDIASVGTKIDDKTPLCRLHAPSVEAADHYESMLRSIVQISDRKPQHHDPLLDIIRGQ